MRKNMSFEERQAYRKRKKLLRRIQVYSEIALIVLAFVVGIGAVITHVKGKDNSTLQVAAEENSSEATTEADTTTGLKVSAKASIEEDDSASEDDTESSATIAGYSASETDSTVSLASDSIVSSYSILINNDTKEIVGANNAYDTIVPASMTKVMTILTAANNITEEQLDEVVTMSSEAIDYSYAGGGSTSGFVEDEEVTVRDLFYGTILPSGGDAAAQLAIYVAGDIDTFVGMMNDTAEQLGISSTTHFTNPVGFYDEDHYSTVYDIAIIMMAALDNDFCNEVLNTKVYNSTATNVNPEGITISNWFLRRIEDKDIGGTINGAKTGYVDESGSCAVSSMTSDSGVNYICCTAKSSSSWQCIYDHVFIYKNYTE